MRNFPKNTQQKCKLHQCRVVFEEEDSQTNENNGLVTRQRSPHSDSAFTGRLCTCEQYKFGNNDQASLSSDEGPASRENVVSENVC